MESYRTQSRMNASTGHRDNFQIVRSIQPNKLRKSTPHVESRTMAIARGAVLTETSDSTGRGTTSAVSTSRSSVSATRWKEKDKVTLEIVSSDQHATDIDHFKQFLQALLYPVTALERYWALRAARAERLLQAQQDLKKEFFAASLTHEERHWRAIAEVDERYAREFAHIRGMIWTLLIAVATLTGLVVFLLVRYVPPAPFEPATRRNTPVHFTIPVLSPFTSVIEHETSAVNIQLVSVLLLAGGISFVLWMKCCTGRR